MIESVKVPASHAWEWYKQGARLFMAQPGMWIVLHLLLFVVSIFASFIPLLGAIALYLFTPALFAGVLYAVREVDENRSIEPVMLFQVFKEKELMNPMLMLGGMYMLSQFVFVIIMLAIMFMFMGPVIFEVMQGTDPATLKLDEQQMILMIIPATLVMTILMVVMIMIFVYAIPLVMFKNVEPLEAMKNSFTACWRNIWTIIVAKLILFMFSIIFTLVFAILMLVLNVFAILPLMFSFVVISAYLCAVWYASFCDIYPDMEETGIMHV